MSLTADQWTDAIHQLNSEGFFGAITLWHNGSTRDAEGNRTYATLEIRNDATQASVKPSELELENAHGRFLLVVAEQNATQGVQDGSLAQAQAIPSWAGWTETQALAWFDANITNLLPAANLAEANTIMTNMATAQRAMARLLVALRNRTWPGLQD